MGVGSKKLENGPGTIYASFPSSLGSNFLASAVSFGGSLLRALDRVDIEGRSRVDGIRRPHHNYQNHVEVDLRCVMLQLCLEYRTRILVFLPYSSLHEGLVGS